MQVFIYEFITGGGMWSLGDDPPSGSLLSEGRAMTRFLSSDFASLGAEPLILLDSRLPAFQSGRIQQVSSAGEEETICQQLAATADWTIVIAPECDGILLRRCEWVRRVTDRLLSPGPSTIALASDKHKTAEHLARHGVRVPQGFQLDRNMHLADVPANLFPGVLKPLDGCGSQGVRRINHRDELRVTAIEASQRLERFIPGLAASVAVLCGPGLLVPLPASEQILSDDGQFRYLGGRTPLPDPLDHRARRLALTAVRSLPDPVGYVGVDLVLGDDDLGLDDCVIEINPRLTTSYVGLHALCRGNLAAAMLAVAAGERPSLSWRSGAVQFSADGQVTSASCTTHLGSNV